MLANFEVQVVREKFSFPRGVGKLSKVESVGKFCNQSMSGPVQYARYLVKQDAWA